MGKTVIESLELSKIEVYPEKFLRFIEELNSIKYIRNLQIYFNEKYEGIFVFAFINIELPSYGVFQGLDIKNCEELLFYISPQYPYKAPYTMMNREDFPFYALPHVNQFIFDGVEPIFKPHICLHRGDVDEWFHEVGVIGYIARVKQWLKDASKGELIKNNDYFEPMMRLDSSFGSIVYDTDFVIRLIENNKKSLVIEYKSMLFSTQDIRKAYVDDNFTPIENNIPCIIVYDKNSNIKDAYLGKYNAKLKDFIKFLDLELIQRAVRHFNNVPNKAHTPIKSCFLIYGIKRPQTLIGQSSDIEFLNCFIIFNRYFTSAKLNISGEEECRVLRHLNPFSKSIATKISDSANIADKKLLLIGCGALGSKISLSLARMGATEQTLVDDDFISPHNLTRHALQFDFLAEKYNINKAEALQFIIDNMYNKNLCKIYKNKIMNLSIEEINGNDYIIDCTASGIVLDYLVSTNNIPPIIRAEIADEGKLGLTFIENKNKSLNLKDLRYILYYEALKNEQIYNWLNNNANNKTDFAHQEFSVGFGCNSDTMILDDAVINVHAGITTSIIKNLSHKDFGLIYINLYCQNDLTKNSVSKIVVEPYKIIRRDDWSIKIKQSVLDEIHTIAYEKFENGGIFIGNADKNDKIIRILDIFIPSDNQRSCSYFIRGQEEVEKYLKHISKRTAGLITYVGEWHTHPYMATQMSTTDENTFNSMAKELAKIQFPAILGIFNNNNESMYIG